MSAILIKNGTVYDGTGAPPKKTDVLIQRTRIARLGDFGRGEAERVVDATGAMVTPGFIETDFEPETEDDVLSEETQRHFLRRGVTAVVDGTDGASLAPLLKPLRRASHDWRSLGELFRILEMRRLAVNFGTLAGYAGLRQAFTGGRDRDLDLRESRALGAALKQALRDGALGVGLGDLRTLRLPEWELLSVAEETAAVKRVLALELGSGEEELGDRLASILAVAKKSGVSMEFSRLEPRAGSSAAVAAALAAIEKQAARAHVNFDVFPVPYARFPIAAFLPPWFRSGSDEETLADLRAVHAKDRLLPYFRKLPLGELRVDEAPRHLRFLNGRKVSELASDWGTRPERAFLRLALMTGLSCKIFEPRIDRRLLAEIVGNPRSLLGLNFHEADLRHGAAGGGDFKEFFAAASLGGKLPEEQVIAKMTGAPAKKFGLARRGVIAPDNFADLVILRDEKVQAVFVNGAEAFADGVVAPRRNGAVVRAGK